MAAQPCCRGFLALAAVTRTEISIAVAHSRRRNSGTIKSKLQAINKAALYRKRAKALRQVAALTLAPDERDRSLLLCVTPDLSPPDRLSGGFCVAPGRWFAPPEKPLRVGARRGVLMLRHRLGAMGSTPKRQIRGDIGLFCAQRNSAKHHNSVALLPG